MTLLVFNVTAAIALWRGLIWSIRFVFGGIILLQFVPYTLFRSQYVLKPDDAQILNGLLGTEALLLGIFAVLELRKLDLFSQLSHQFQRNTNSHSSHNPP